MRSLMICFALLTTVASRADDEVIMLSPFSVDSTKESIPPVTIKKTGDYLLLEVEMVNDTRDPEKRRQEIYDTVRGVITSSRDVADLEISTREMVLNLQNYQVRLDDRRDKVDTSSVQLLLRLPLAASDDVAALTSKLRQFSNRVQVVGRTEVFPGEIGISVKNPERFRYELIGRIAEDVTKLRELFGGAFEVLVKGLDQRLQWRRSSVSELEFYLPYSYDILPNKALPLILNGRE